MPVPRASNSSWSVGGPFAESAGANVYGGGGNPVTPAQRLDKLRMGENQLPDAQYPDGYLGAVTSRRSDRADDQLRTRLNDRAYQRGVHKATKMPQDAYYWPADFGPDSGLEAQARGRRDGNVIMTPRWCSTPGPVERYSAGMSMSDAELASVYQRYGINAHTAQGTDTVDPARQQVMSRALPPYSW